MMNEWQETLRIEHDGVIADVNLPFLKNKGLVILCFEANTSESVTIEEAKAAAESVNRMLNKLLAMQALVADAAFKYYQYLVDAFQYDDVQLPKAGDANALQSFYQLTAIYMSKNPGDGHFGLAFECEFEIEHGMGIRFRDWQIEEVGGEEVSFSLD